MSSKRTQYIVWKLEYSVGNDSLDSQHREIFTIINTLHTQIQSGLSDKEFRLRLTEANDYAELHFRFEEKAMRDCGYPDIEGHVREHHKYRQGVRVLAKQKPSHTDSVSFELLHFLKTWWLKHVIIMDQAYAPFLRARDPDAVSDTGDRSSDGN